MSNQKQISIVCAVYNEEACIPVFYQRLRTALTPLRDRYRFELIFTNNRSTDGTLAAICKLREQDPDVHVLTYSRNFGYEASIATGLRYARGEAIIAIDVDGEDPPEMLTEFVAGWEQGYDVVYGKRDQRKEFVGIHWMRKAFYRICRLMADADFVIDMAEFYLISSRVRDVVIANQNTMPFLRADVAYAGFERKGISYERQYRIAGRSHFNLWRALKFAVAGILSSSTFPLRLPVHLFPLLTAVNLILLATDKFNWLVTLDLLYLALFMAMACIYIARVYKDLVQRPAVVIDWKQSYYTGATAKEPLPFG
jgi:dolichol-phosphate mannosyltransferase